MVWSDNMSNKQLLPPALLGVYCRLLPDFQFLMQSTPSLSNFGYMVQVFFNTVILLESNDKTADLLKNCFDLVQLEKSLYCTVIPKYAGGDVWKYQNM